MRSNSASFSTLCNTEFMILNCSNADHMLKLILKTAVDQLLTEKCNSNSPLNFLAPRFSWLLYSKKRRLVLLFVHLISKINEHHFNYPCTILIFTIQAKYNGNYLLYKISQDNNLCGVWYCNETLYKAAWLFIPLGILTLHLVL